MENDYPEDFEKHPELYGKPVDMICPCCNCRTGIVLYLVPDQKVATCHACGKSEYVSCTEHAELYFGQCEYCGEDTSFDLRDVEEGETRLLYEPCRKCGKRIAELRDLVDCGGVFFSCKACGKKGALSREHPLAQKFRAAHGFSEAIVRLVYDCEDHAESEGKVLFLH